MSKQTTLASLEQIRRRDLSAEKIHPSGAIQVSAVIGGERIHRRYIGFTKPEAINRFLNETQPAELSISPL